MLAGTLAAVDTAERTVTVRPVAGADITYRLTDKTQVLRAKKASDLSAFKTGDAVVVRFRRSTAGPASLYDLADRVSWEWIYRLRREITPVTVAQIDDDSMRAVEGADRAEVTYRFTDRTSWSRAGKRAAASDFKAGDRVFVAPRMLPGGGLMATAVADTADAAAKLQEQARATVSGTVRTVNAEKRELSLHTAAGSDWDLQIAPDCVVRVGSHDAALAAVHAGQSVSIHVSRNEADQPVVMRITVRTRGKTRMRPPAHKATTRP